MKIFWKKKTEEEAWQLLIEPAALLLTIAYDKKNWTLKCLGHCVIFAGMDCSLENAQKYAVQWLSNELFAIQKVLDRGIPCTSGS